MKNRTLRILAIVLAASFVALTGCTAMAPGGYYTPDMDAAMDGAVEAPDENYRYDEIIERGFVKTAETASSYFSLDRNTAGYAFMRSQIKQNLQISKDSVRLEEYVNYFTYDYPAPATGEGIGATAYLAPCPWNEEHKLLTIGIKTEESYLSSDGGNYVFLVDVSGSMSGSSRYESEGEYLSRLDLVKYGLKKLVEGLGEGDNVAIVTYASGVQERLASTPVTEKNRDKIIRAIDGLSTAGSTFGSGGIELAYKVAQKGFRTGGNNRVVLLSDGDFNVGTSGIDELKELISEKAKSGIYLSVLGVGMGNTRDDLMQVLALNGNGNYAYIDSKLEAEKVFCEELSGTLYTVAKDAKAGVTFNAEAVESYRLLGYDMKRMSESDFENTEKDAGEIGSNLCVTAIYEIAPKADIATDASLADIHIKWKDTAEQNREKKLTVTNAENGTPDTAFAACVAEFALVLRDSQYAGQASLESVAARLRTMQSYIADDPYKAEFERIVALAIESERYFVTPKDTIPDDTTTGVEDIELPDISELSEELINEIKLAYIGDRADNHTVNDVHISKYCGTYNGAVVLMLEGVYAYTEAEMTVNVAGVSIRYCDGNQLRIYKDGELYMMPEAYDAGCLTVADMEQIRDIFYAAPSIPWPQQ